MRDNKVVKIILTLLAIAIGLKLLGFIISILFGIAFPLIFVGGSIIISILFLAIALAITGLLIYGVYRFFASRN